MAEKQIPLNEMETVKFIVDGVEKEVEILYLDGKLIWEKSKFVPTAGLIYSGLDVNGNPEFIEDIANSPYYKSNPDYDGTAVAYYVGRIYQYAISQNYYSPDIDYETDSLNFGGKYNDKPVVGLGNGILYSSRMTNLKVINIGDPIEKIKSGCLALYTIYNDLTINLGKGLKTIECKKDKDSNEHTLAFGNINDIAQHKIILNIESENLVLEHGDDGSGIDAREYYSFAFYTDTTEINVKQSVNSLTNISFNLYGNKKTFTIEQGTNPLILTTNDSYVDVGFSRLFDDTFELVVYDRPLIFPISSRDNYKIFHSKNAVTFSNIFTNNQDLLNYDWGSDNITPTIYHLDKTTVYQQLVAPTITLTDSILTITPSENASKFEIIDGYSNVLTTTTETTIDLSQYLTTTGTYTVTARALADGYVSSIKSESVTYTIGE